MWSRRFERALRPFREVFVSCRLGLRKPSREAFAPRRLRYLVTVADEGHMTRAAERLAGSGQRPR